jgi:hypothetical protein
MTSSKKPADQEQLAGEIRQTRTELGDTVEALAAKTDVTGRAKQAVSDTAAQAQRRLSEAGTKTAQMAGSAKQHLVEAQHDPTTRRRALPAAAIAAAAVLGTTIIVVRRRRAAARRVSGGRSAWLRRFR